jgi:hypothetical protein
MIKGPSDDDRNVFGGGNLVYVMGLECDIHGDCRLLDIYVSSFDPGSYFHYDAPCWLICFARAESRPRSAGELTPAKVCPRCPLETILVRDEIA